MPEILKAVPHAVCRYVERVNGGSGKFAKEQLVAIANAADRIQVGPDGEELRKAGDLHMVVCGGRIVTCFFPRPGRVPRLTGLREGRKPVAPLPAGRQWNPEGGVAVEQSRGPSEQVERLCGKAIDLLEQIYQVGVNRDVDDLDDAIPWDEVFDLLQDYDEEVRKPRQEAGSKVLARLAGEHLSRDAPAERDDQLQLSDSRCA